MFRWILKAILAGMLCGVVFTGGWYALRAVKTSSIFAVKQVEIKGTVKTDREKLASMYAPLAGQNIFTEIDDSFLLSDDPWVAKLEIKRELPSRLVVEVTEEEEIISYKKGSACWVLTARGREIETGCAGIKVNIASMPLQQEFVRFIAIYSGCRELKDAASIILKSGIFTADTGGMKITGSYEPDVFMDNYKVFEEKIRARYSAIERLDISVQNRIFVKGVTGG